jgi:transcriptional regulator with XRE-family HTH domain
MTQKFLAMRLHISQNQLCKYERGVDRIAFEMMVEIADILRVPLDRFRPPADVLEAARLEGRDPLLAALRRQQAEGGRAGA